MALFESLLRRRIGALLTWLAIISLGAAAVARDLGAFERIDGPPASSSVTRAAPDAGHPFLRAGALTLVAHYRGNDDDRRFDGGDKLLLTPLVPALPAPVTVIARAVPVRHAVRAPIASAPYAARAPPVRSI